jgi:SAM-dependent methyltransferase
MGQQTAYDQHLAYREEFMSVGPRFYLRTGLMRRLLAGLQGRLLDVGCGDGFFLLQLRRLGFNCAGLDPSAQMIERCRRRPGLEGVELLCGVLDGYQPSQPFDVAVCGETLEHIEDDVAALRQVHRLLRPGGVLVLTVPVDMRLWNEADREAGHFRRYSKGEILDKLQRAGFTPQQHVVWGYPITRALHFRIREQQKSLMSGPARPGRRRWLRQAMALGRYVFLLDNLFNFTERGVGIAVRAVRGADGEGLR